MEESPQQPLNPWKHIFLHPKETIEWVMENNPEQFYRKLFWVYYLSLTISSILASYIQLTGLSKTISLVLIVAIIISPISSFLYTYLTIYARSFIVNIIVSEFFGEKRPFKLAKEVLVWGIYTAGVLTFGVYCLKALVHTFSPQLYFLTTFAEALILCYGLFIHANIFRALYHLPRTKSYLFAGIATLFGLLVLTLRDAFIKI